MVMIEEVTFIRLQELDNFFSSVRKKDKKGIEPRGYSSNKTRKSIKTSSRRLHATLCSSVILEGWYI